MLPRSRHGEFSHQVHLLRRLRKDVRWSIRFFTFSKGSRVLGRLTPADFIVHELACAEPANREIEFWGGQFDADEALKPRGRGGGGGGGGRRGRPARPRRKKRSDPLPLSDMDESDLFGLDGGSGSHIDTDSIKCSSASSADVMCGKFKDRCRSPRGHGHGGDDVLGGGAGGSRGDHRYQDGGGHCGVDGGKPPSLFSEDSLDRLRDEWIEEDLAAAAGSGLGRKRGNDARRSGLSAAHPLALRVWPPPPLPHQRHLSWPGFCSS